MFEKIVEKDWDNSRECKRELRESEKCDHDEGPFEVVTSQFTMEFIHCLIWYFSGFLG